MLLTYDKFGGIVPRIFDPRLIPAGKGQVAKNCRFDHGGVMPIGIDETKATPTKTGTLKSIFLYQDQYWFAWITDVDAVLTPVSNDAWKRVYFTENGVLKVTDLSIALSGGTNYPENYYLPSPPAPILPLVCAVAGTITNNDPTLEETRFYTFTYVNSYGDEGPPCANISNKVVWAPGQHVTISTSETIPSGAYNLAAVRVYRVNQDASNNEQYQLVYETAVANLSGMPDDTVDSAALGEILQSAEWDGAPSGVTGLIELPNAGMACYVGNALCLSVPGFPHAWPVRYQKTTERDIVALVGWGTTVVALTTGVPEAVTFTDPGNSVPEKITVGLACTSKLSVVDMGNYFAYSSPEGLVAIGPGKNEVMTEKLFSRTEWTAYKPDSISGYMWEGMYVGFYDTGSKQAGFIFDPSTLNFVDLDFYATAGYRDPKTGILYLQVGVNIVSFATSSTARTMDNKSRREIFKLTMFTAIKVLATAYPVTIDVIYPDLVDSTGAAAPQTITVTVTSSAPQRLPVANSMIDAAEVRVYGTKGASVVYLASDIMEFYQ